MNFVVRDNQRVKAKKKKTKIWLNKGIRDESDCDQTIVRPLWTIVKDLEKRQGDLEIRQCIKTLAGIITRVLINKGEKHQLLLVWNFLSRNNSTNCYSNDAIESYTKETQTRLQIYSVEGKGRLPHVHIWY